MEQGRFVVRQLYPGLHPDDEITRGRSVIVGVTYDQDAAQAIADELGAELNRRGHGPVSVDISPVGTAWTVSARRARGAS